MDEMPPVMTAKELAALLRTTVDALAQDRYLGRGIPFTKVGARVRYLRDDVVNHLTAHRTDEPQSRMICRDSITGGPITATRDGHFVKIVDDGVDVLHLTPAAAVELARQIIESATPGGAP